VPRAPLPDESIVDRIRATTLGLPEAYEEDAWTGVRWCVRGRNFAHVLVVDDGKPHSYARSAEVDGAATVLTFRAVGDELVFLANAGPPYFKPPWSATVVGVVLGADTDWTEVAELLTESYRACAPQKLVRLLGQP
jgi:hypothetical protein